MSTYTDYKLVADDNVYDLKFSLACIDGLKNTLIDILFDRNHEINATWYEHEEHMLEFSKLNPKCRFTLYGVSEDFITCLKKWCH